MKFLHSMIRVSNLEKSLEFYTRLLGLKLSRKAALDDCTLYWLKDEITGAEIELTDNNIKDDYKNGDVFGHFAFETANLDEFTKKVHSMGYEYLYEPFNMPLEGDTLRVAFLKDPDGNEIELIEAK
ncbi:MAG: VOC family protein [Candidatus Gastranaerophilales bacterium]|nr:VOC family protein [Candidatus Gastranaerophilales bacterium]